MRLFQDICSGTSAMHLAKWPAVFVVSTAVGYRSSFPFKFLSCAINNPERTPLLYNEIYSFNGELKFG